MFIAGRPAAKPVSLGDSELLMIYLKKSSLFLKCLLPKPLLPALGTCAGLGTRGWGPGAGAAEVWSGAARGAGGCWGQIRGQLPVLQKKREILCPDIVRACVRTFLLTWEVLLMRNKTTASWQVVLL